jgi:hypothetical protein
MPNLSNLTLAHSFLQLKPGTILSNLAQLSICGHPAQISSFTLSELLHALPNLLGLNLNTCNLTLDLLCAISARCSWLESLELHCTSADDDITFSSFRTLRNLASVKLYKTGIEAVVLFEGLEHVLRLDLDNVRQRDVSPWTFDVPVKELILIVPCFFLRNWAGPSLQASLHSLVIETHCETAVLEVLGDMRNLRSLKFPLTAYEQFQLALCAPALEHVHVTNKLSSRYLKLLRVLPLHVRKIMQAKRSLVRCTFVRFAVQSCSSIRELIGCAAKLEFVNCLVDHDM